MLISIHWCCKNVIKKCWSLCKHTMELILMGWTKSKTNQISSDSFLTEKGNSSNFICFLLNLGLLWKKAKAFWRWKGRGSQVKPSHYCSFITFLSFVAESREMLGRDRTADSLLTWFDLEIAVYSNICREMNQRYRLTVWQYWVPDVCWPISYT